MGTTFQNMMSLSGLTSDTGAVSIPPYRDDRPPLPPLAPARTRGTQNLPPVRNLLSRPATGVDQQKEGNVNASERLSGRKVRLWVRGNADLGFVDCAVG